MMDVKRMKFVVCVSVVLVSLSIGTDFGAQVARVFKEYVHYPRRLASLLKIIAAVGLAIAHHAIINVKTELFFCARVPRQLNVNSTAIVGTFIRFCSWFTFALAFHCFLVSAVIDLGYFQDTLKEKPISYFLNGALLSFYCLWLDLIYYRFISLTLKTPLAAPHKVIPLNQADIDLGQPLLPPTNC